MKFKAHPWHGLSFGENYPEILSAFIEIVPTDTVKYEIDKASGYLKIDRPQKYSNTVPALYGFVPQTYCGAKIAALATEKAGKVVEDGDGDPLDILVLTEKIIPHGDIICEAIPIGGLRLIDKNEADDKIIAVLKDDAVYGKYTDLGQLPTSILKRLEHYFLTYKAMPGDVNVCEISNIYGADEAKLVLKTAAEDYIELAKTL